MPQDDFSAQVNAWVAQTNARILAVRNESAQRVVEVMQTPVAAGGHMHVDTGFLRASLRATIGEPEIPVTFNPQNGQSFSYDAGAVSLVIADAKITDILTFVYGANYAIYREYGANGQMPDAFVRMAAQQWPQIVEKVALEAQSGAGG